VTDIRLFALLAATALVLLFFLVDEQADLKDRTGKITSLEQKLAQAKETIEQNQHILLPAKQEVRNPGLLAEKSLRTVVSETTEQLGISGNIEAINPSEDKKNNTLRARVSLRSIPIRKIVAFIVHVRNLSAGIRDVEATMRMQGYNTDSWRIDLTLEAPRGALAKATTDEK
jgi:hypothetical protein